MAIEEDKMFCVVGGASTTISSTFINALARMVSTLFNMGKTIGSTLYRLRNKNYCN